MPTSVGAAKADISFAVDDLTYEGDRSQDEYDDSEEYKIAKAYGAADEVAADEPEDHDDEAPAGGGASSSTTAGIGASFDFVTCKACMGAPFGKGFVDVYDPTTGDKVGQLQPIAFSEDVLKFAASCNIKSHTKGGVKCSRIRSWNVGKEPPELCAIIFDKMVTDGDVKFCGSAEVSPNEIRTGLAQRAASRVIVVNNDTPLPHESNLVRAAPSWAMG